MFLTVHATAGAVIGAAAANPVLAFLLGLLSHAALDIIPHGDENLVTGTERERFRKTIVIGLVDLAIMCGVLAVILRPWDALPSLAVLAAVFGGILPDGLQVLHLLLPRNQWLARYQSVHDHVHLRIIAYENSLPAGMSIQALTFVAIVTVHRWVL